jgi:hypothetical protein
MPDWKSIAQARALSIPPQDLDRLSKTLDGLEEVFRPLAEDLSSELEPSVTFRPQEAE